MAIAPEQMGIGIRRHFTSADVHPYDMVRWERRDARITNFRDGTVAFEQRDVEFPTTWSLNATNIVAQKYFRGHLDTPEREWSLRQVIDRVVDTITAWGIKDGYFLDDEEAAAFRAELKYILVTQRAAFNSPVWFNIGVRGEPQQASACFILAVDDTMDSILNWYREEGVIFKGGSGAGVNLSKIRSSAEHLKGGGTASGPVSFMRGADASAGTIKSGGKTRRAAKMVILDVDHPDIEDFIACKALEERKARVLRDAGFDMDLDGRDSHSIQYQNANNSVRVTDEFMQAVVDDRDWDLVSRTSGQPVKTVKARDLMRQIAQASWECADPGMQYDTTINRWHTAATTGRINASNPCFTGDTLVHTDKGLIRFRELFDRANQGEVFGVYTHDVTNAHAPSHQMLVTTPEAFMITGVNEILRLRFSNGMELRCTPGHRIFTVNRGYVEAKDLTPDDAVQVLDLPAPAVNADVALPVPTDAVDYRTKGDHGAPLQLPEQWTEDFAHYLGWVIGDGSTSGATVSTIYGTASEQVEVLPRHQELLAAINDGRLMKPSEQANGTVQLRIARRGFKRFLEALGVASVKGPDKRVPWAVEQAPATAVAGFLRGLFDADGCAVVNAEKGSYVGLGSVSPELLRGVQRLLSTFGISSRIYKTKEATDAGSFSYVRKDGTEVVYGSRQSFDLRITSRSVERFAAEIGFTLSEKRDALREIVTSRTRGFYDLDTTVRLTERSDDGVELTYNLSEPRNHSYVANGVVVRNCSEYMHLDNSACNLASINLLKYLDDDGDFDVDAYTHTVETVFTAQEILVGNADYPTEPIAENSRRFRQLGLGYANLGAMLMALGHAYDSNEGRAWAAAVTALMTGHAYATSSRTAARMGAFAGYSENKDHMLRVLAMHRDAASQIDEDRVPVELLSAAQESWDVACELAHRHGVRNAQASVLAPTGCLVGGSLIATDHGLVRLRSLGDPDGPQWQDIDVDVFTDEGAKRATKFYVNGLESVVDVRTARGYRIQGTTKHRIKVVDAAGEWVWRRFADLRPGDVVPLALGGLVGQPRVVSLPPLAETSHWAAEHHVRVPRTMTAELAELVGYFMGDGSLHAKGLRLCVSEHDVDVVDHLARLGKALFGIEPSVVTNAGYVSVELNSVRLAEWWDACGFAKHRPHEAHTGKGYTPHIPDAVLASNDREVYRSFVRGLFEADGTVTGRYPSWTTTSRSLSQDVQTLLLALGFVTTRKGDVSGRGSELHVLRLLNKSANARWHDEIGFISSRKDRAIDTSDCAQSARHDHIPVSRDLLDRVAGDNDRDGKVALMELRRSGSITRRLATELYERTGDAELGHLLGFFFDRITSAELADEELTYDLSVPENVTYTANGFISHNTIGLMMDCDTTGIEPDLGLVKMKKLVGGGNMSIVNQTIPRALRRLGYTPEQVSAIIAYIDEHKSLIGSPDLRPEHLEVFACSMGDNTIHYLGHVKMMAAVQPFISGAISKTINMPEQVTVEDVEDLHIVAWRMGLKAIAIYRDNCKVAQPLSAVKKEAVAAEVEKVVEKVIVREPTREKLPRRRVSKTFSFRVADCHGYVTVGEYEDGRPGELFLKVSKQGSTLAGIMDAFAISVSHGLQYGVPLKAFVDMFTNMRFEPAGMTDDPDIRFAASLVDYIFRRLAIEYLPLDERMELGILSVGERLQPTLPGVEEAAIESVSVTGGDVTPSFPVSTESIDLASPAGSHHPDAPLCMTCGVQMQRAGSCHACPSCGATSGCS